MTRALNAAWVLAFAGFCCACAGAPKADRVPATAVQWRQVELGTHSVETWATTDPGQGLLPVVLVPGMSGSAQNALAWSTLVDALSRQRQVMGLSLR